MIRLERTTNQEQWNDFVLDNGGHPLQLWEWGQVKSAHGWRAERLFGYDEDEKLCAAAQVLLRKLPWPLKAVAYVPRGFVGEQGSSMEFLDAVAAFCKREYGAVSLLVEPDMQDFSPDARWKVSHNPIIPAQTIQLALTNTESELLSRMAKKTRQYIRKSTAEAGTIRQLSTKEEIGQLIDVYRQTSRRAGFNLHDEQYYYDVFTLLGDHSPVFGMYEGDELVAFLWLAISADTSYELYGGVSPRGQELRANYALKWHAIRKTKEWGLKTYDFGGLIGDGVSNFKRGWTDTDTELSGSYELPLSPLYGVWGKLFPLAKKLNQKIGSLRR